ncbi:hypothetical protein, partial [Nocardia cyriacigeorgica]|uniref:hypothetical protein n=1 Tax=Nocardia cyriacigeorgica TaxID=135487 RepID=UPI001E4A6395
VEHGRVLSVELGELVVLPILPSEGPSAFVSPWWCLQRHDPQHLAVQLRLTGGYRFASGRRKVGDHRGGVLRTIRPPCEKSPPGGLVNALLTGDAAGRDLRLAPNSPDSVPRRSQHSRRTPLTPPPAGHLTY